METYGLQPNTTQVPHIIIREWMPQLKDVELRVLLVVTDQTLGWEADKETGRRKEDDWIAHSQLIQKTGRSNRAISSAVKKLIETHGIIEARDSDGRLLDKPELRMKCGDKIFYRLSLRPPQPTLFSTQAKSARVRVPMQNLRAQKVHATKETISTKETNISLQPAEPVASKPREKSEHAQIVETFHDVCQRARGVKPKITGADGMNLKRALGSGMTIQQLTQLTVYFLGSHRYRQFAPSISTMLSSGIINGLMNKARNDGEFWRELDGLMQRYLKSPAQGTRAEMAQKLEQLKSTILTRMTIAK